ncbi:MAG: AAA family ATPase [Desulfuromonadales bacterium]|nr:AAA family ATPase [Desulfuromonadales bacterium]
MTKLQVLQPPDWQERQKAVDINLSCIVQAPAGSGKTELLVQRILALLAVAESPEEILSITFTRKAAGEMKLRLLQALERACDDQPPDEPHAVETWQRARAVLARDQEKDWCLLQNPNRLQLMTIDSFCAFLTRRMPWLARFGGQPKVPADPANLFLLAAESLLPGLTEVVPARMPSNVCCLIWTTVSRYCATCWWLCSASGINGYVISWLNAT